MFRDLCRLLNVNIPNILYCVCDARHILLKNITASAGWVKPVLFTADACPHGNGGRKARKGY